ncbi:MAG TPA: helix-turn-helix transcriptional regulator, partial [Gammaproteobacteria bacterium]|nr:helix-turn-helix transcriptional regulator [Gammaproteobacteria bacterium]
MSQIERDQFSERLNEALDSAGIPAKGKGRQTKVGKMFGVSQKGARKWLEGEAIPATARIREMAARLNVSAEWLLTGHGSMERGTEPRARQELQRTHPEARRLPVINYIQAGHPKEVVDAYAEGDGFDTIGVDEDMARTLGPHAFALQVE